MMLYVKGMFTLRSGKKIFIGMSQIESYLFKLKALDVFFTRKFFQISRTTHLIEKEFFVLASVRFPPHKSSTSIYVINGNGLILPVGECRLWYKRVPLSTIILIHSKWPSLTRRIRYSLKLIIFWSQTLIIV